MSTLPRGMASGILMLNGAPHNLLPSLPEREPRPEGYGVHLTKAERRGKSFDELQRLRQERRQP